MKIGASGSPGMVTTLRRAIRYAQVDRSARRIIIDERALFLGMLSSGQLDTPSASFGNTATWIASWIEQRSRIRLDVSAGMTGTDALLQAAQQEFAVVTSADMTSAGSQAVAIARQTVQRAAADLRHFVAALLAGRRALPLLSLPGWTATTADLAALRQELYDRILLNPERGENLDAWRSVLAVAAPAQPAPATIGSAKPAARKPTAKKDAVTKPAVKRAARLSGGDQASTEPATPPLPDDPTTTPPTEVSGFASDRPGSDAASDDPLDLLADVTAFARLICLQDVAPPLSIGLFGGWGSGKSTFMHLLEARIDDLTGKARDKHARLGATNLAPDAPAAEPRFIRNAVQIRFNAWHFADANLWASLTAEFFDQLRAGGYARSGKAIHARLVERVNSYVHTLTAEAKASREALAESEMAVRDAQKERDDAAVKATATVGSALTQTLIDAVTGAYAAHRDDLDELGGKRSAKDIASFVALARSLQTIGGQAATLWHFVFARGWRGALAVAGALLVALSSYFIVNTDLLSGAGLIRVAAFIAGLGALARTILP
ncbi:MAG: P-loop NTPase fold protein, partial [Cypionkella sp.]